MGRIPEKPRQLIGLAQRRAFDTYLRFGRWPDADMSPPERKAVPPSAPLPPSVPARATRFYVWRTAGDTRVREGHVHREGKVFRWSEPPEGGHPGTEPNCRCWAEPYYGDPDVPDALQPLRHSHVVNTDPTQLWASIETLTRPDGGLAHSLVALNDGTVIEGQFQATSILRTVTLADGTQIRVDTESGLQSIYIAGDSAPLFQSRWTPHGPKVVRARRHVAFLLERDPFDDPLRPDLPMLGGGSGGVGGGGGSGSIDLGAIAFALTSIFRIQHAAPASQGLGESDEPVLVVKSWTVDPEGRPVPILVDSLTEEQQRQACRFLPDVQDWTDDAAALLADKKPILPARTWGSLVHGEIKRRIDALKASLPFIYRNLFAEVSFSSDPSHRVHYGMKGSTRLDVVEDRSEDMKVVCNYDIKTGREGLTLARLKEIADRLSKRYPGVTIYIFEVRPQP